MLAYLYEESAKGNKVRSTDLVKKLRFGTLPTVTSHIQKLIETGLIEQVVAEDDRRVRWLKPTAAADTFFEQRAELLVAAGFGFG